MILTSQFRIRGKAQAAIAGKKAMARGDRRQQIMRAVEKLFKRRRFHEVTLDDVTREANIGKGTIYRYFRDKDDLIVQTVLSGYDEMCELIRGKAVKGSPFATQLRSLCSEISRFYENRRPLIHLMQSEEGRLFGHGGRARELWHRQRAKLVSAMAEVMDKGKQEGAVRTDIPSEVMAGFLLGMLRTRARELAEVSAADHGVEVVVELFCHGAEPTEGAGRVRPVRQVRQVWQSKSQRRVGPHKSASKTAC